MNDLAEYEVISGYALRDRLEEVDFEPFAAQFDPTLRPYVVTLGESMAHIGHEAIASFMNQFDSLPLYDEMPPEDDFAWLELDDGGQSDEPTAYEAQAQVTDQIESELKGVLRDSQKQRRFRRMPVLSGVKTIETLVYRGVDKFSPEIKRAADAHSLTFFDELALVDDTDDLLPNRVSQADQLSSYFENPHFRRVVAERLLLGDLPRERWDEMSAIENGQLLLSDLHHGSPRKGAQSRMTTFVRRMLTHSNGDYTRKKTDLVDLEVLAENPLLLPRLRSLREIDAVDLVAGALYRNTEHKFLNPKRHNNSAQEAQARYNEIFLQQPGPLKAIVAEVASSDWLELIDAIERIPTRSARIVRAVMRDRPLTADDFEDVFAEGPKPTRQAEAALRDLRSALDYPDDVNDREYSPKEQEQAADEARSLSDEEYRELVERLPRESALYLKYIREDDPKKRKDYIHNENTRRQHDKYGVYLTHERIVKGIGPKKALKLIRRYKADPTDDMTYTYHEMAREMRAAFNTLSEDKQRDLIEGDYWDGSEARRNIFETWVQFLPNRAIGERLGIATGTVSSTNRLNLQNDTLRRFLLGDDWRDKYKIG